MKITFPKGKKEWEKELDGYIDALKAKRSEMREELACLTGPHGRAALKNRAT